jgi:2,3,4,5-tetrahydropyridine-2-carboxylate N-succinyltransferase
VTLQQVRTAIEALADGVPSDAEGEARAAFNALKEALNRGEARAAERGSDGIWRVNVWVKQGVLLGFRLGEITDQSGAGPLRFFDKDTYPLRPMQAGDGIRIVPGGSSVRDGCYLAPGVVCMPPMYVNVGAYVDEESMIDSHVLVGSCAQIGKRVHLSAGAQIGGVLEPVGATPVIIEDDVFVGGNCGIYEGTTVRAGCVLAAGTVLTGATPVYDVVRNDVYRRTADRPLEIPEGAVVVPGSRRITKGTGAEMGLSLYTPVIVKYRDERTDRSVRLEDLLR